MSTEHSAPEGGEADLATGLLDAAVKQLIALSMGGCTCGVKTFQVQWHDPTCTFRRAQEILENVEEARAALKQD